MGIAIKGLDVRRIYGQYIFLKKPFRDRLVYKVLLCRSQETGLTELGSEPGIGCFAGHSIGTGKTAASKKFKTFLQTADQILGKADVLHFADDE